MGTPKCKYFKRNLTDYYVRSIKAAYDMQVSDTEIRGLQLRYYCRTGLKVFYLSYVVRHTLRQRNLMLGRYGEFSIKEIRMRAATFRQQIADCRDPMQEQIDGIKKQQDEGKKQVKVKDLFPEYMEKYSRIKKKKNTCKGEESQIRNYILPHLGEVAVSDLDLPTLTDFHNTIAKKTSFSTAGRTMALISSFWNWCERYKYLPINSNPCRHVETRKNEKMEYQTLDLDGYKKLFSMLGQGLKNEAPYHPRAFRAIKVLALTGCRCSEITTLKKTDLDLEHNLLNLKDSKTGAKKVPLGAPAVEELKCAMQDSDAKSPYVFPATRGGGALIDLRKAFRWALEKAGLPMMRIHDLRHSFATLATEMGEDIRAISKVLGHSNTTTTEIYAHMANTRKITTANNVAMAIAG